ncbi:putative dehydrogenase [Deinococcus metalli]|uniref:Oxidoreductase n=1 Tax=Deinococcus metalli TaxID=1141878 RepID=A0A7W8KJA4_9DEIO|nr:Gfo/Idh/MocA family oxidoreductase [Deinococcus metalli]MBB5377986.1 putative dehydrogenase [Deinococcus metalli]GHF53561.1 oxidoreductase [Deinococcus metalli]
MTPLNVVIVGCGVIATPYAEGFADFPTLRLHGCFDVDASKRDAFAAAQGCRPYPSLEAALADPDADLIVNLTVLPAHYDVTKRALEAGKHVFSEKPLAASSAQAQELVALARDRGVRLGCAPVTHLGHAQQRAGQELRAGRIGPVRVIYAEANHARIETWHGAPHSFYRVGPLRDVGVYPLGVITSIFGPARRVWAYGTAVKPERVTKRGEPFEVEAPDWYVAVIELAAGPVVRLTASFYVTDRGKQPEAIEFHGDDGQLFLAHWFSPSAALEVAAFGQGYAPLEDFTPSTQEFRWAVALDEMARAIAEGRPHRVSGEQAAHLVEILEAAHLSIERGGAVELTTTFTAPEPLPGGPGPVA